MAVERNEWMGHPQDTLELHCTHSLLSTGYTGICIIISSKPKVSVVIIFYYIIWNIFHHDIMSLCHVFVLLLLLYDNVFSIFRSDIER